MFNEMAGVKLAHIPSKGSGPSFTDLIGEQVSVTFDNLVQALPYVQTNKLRALAVLAPERSPLLPDVPMLSEAGEAGEAGVAGVAGYSFANWFGMVAPLGTPPERIQKLDADIRCVLEPPAVRDQLARMGPCRRRQHRIGSANSSMRTAASGARSSRSRTYGRSSPCQQFPEQAILSSSARPSGQRR